MPPFRLRPVGNGPESVALHRDRLSHFDLRYVRNQEIEDYFSGPALHRNLMFVDRYQKRASVFELKPGYGLHIPTTHPHWIRSGDAVSVSFSVSFKTRASLQRGWVYNVNGRLRKLGVPPTPQGSSALRDAMKCQFFRALSRTQSWPERKAPRIDGAARPRATETFEAG